MGRRKERVPHRIPDDVWKNLDKPAADVGVDVGGVELALGLFEAKIDEWVINGRGEIMLKRADDQMVKVEVKVFRSEAELRGFKERSRVEGESWDRLNDRLVEQGIAVVNGRAKLQKAKGTLRHQLERISASTFLISGN